MWTFILDKPKEENQCKLVSLRKIKLRIRSFLVYHVVNRMRIFATFFNTSITISLKLYLEIALIFNLRICWNFLELNKENITIQK